MGGLLFGVNVAAVIGGAFVGNILCRHRKKNNGALHVKVGSYCPQRRENVGNLGLLNSRRRLSNTVSTKVDSTDKSQALVYQILDVQHSMGVLAGGTEKPLE